VNASWWNDVLSEILHAHFKAPRNAGRIAGATGRGRAEHEACGDLVEIEVRVENGRVADVGFLAQGCAATLACASFVTERARGLEPDVVRSFDADELLAAVSETGATRRHGMTLAIRALAAALTGHTGG
jgi:nitrogen fixation protein NifU and related proteins